MQLQRVSPLDPRLPKALVASVRVSPGVHRAIFFVVTHPGMLLTMGSDGSVVLCAPAKTKFTRFVLPTAANRTAPGVWDLGKLFASASMPTGVVVSYMKSLSGNVWSELARPTDQHGEYAGYERDHDLLPCAAEAPPPELEVTDQDYRFLLNVLDPEAMKPVKTGGVKVGPIRMATYFGVVPSHMPRVFSEGDAWHVQYKTFTEVLIVYGASIANNLLRRYIKVDGVAQPVPGCTIEGSLVTVTLDLHFTLIAGTRSLRMWQDTREASADILRNSAESFIEVSSSGELLGVMEKNPFYESPSALDICVAKIMVAIGERKRHRMSNALADATDFPSCLRLDPTSWWDSNSVKARRQQIFTMTGLQQEGHTAISQKLRTLIEHVYDNAYKPASVSKNEFEKKQRERRSSVFASPKALYPAPKCSSCPLGFENASQCLPGNYDPHAHVNVADVIVARAKHRIQEVESEAELDQIAAEMEL